MNQSSKQEVLTVAVSYRGCPLDGYDILKAFCQHVRLKYRTSRVKRELRDIDGNQATVCAVFRATTDPITPDIRDDINRLVAYASTHTGIDASDILGRSHRPEFSRPRHTIAFVVRTRHDLSYEHISMALGRTSQAMYHAIWRHFKGAKIDKTFYQTGFLPAVYLDAESRYRR